MKEKLGEKLLIKLKSDKKLLLILAVGILGMALIFLSEVKTTSDKSQKDPLPSETATYEESVEKKLKALVESIEGA